MKKISLKISVTFIMVINLSWSLAQVQINTAEADNLLAKLQQNPDHEIPLKFNDRKNFPWIKRYGHYFHYSSGELEQNLIDFKEYYKFSTTPIKNETDFENAESLKFTNESIKFSAFNVLIQQILNDPEYKKYCKDNAPQKKCFAGIRDWIGLNNTGDKLILIYEPVILEATDGYNYGFYDVRPLSSKIFYIADNQNNLVPIEDVEKDAYLKQYQSQNSNLYIHHIYKENPLNAYKFINYTDLEKPDITLNERIEQFYYGDLQYDVFPVQQLLELHSNNPNSITVNFTLGASQSRYIPSDDPGMDHRNFRLHTIFHVLSINETLSPDHVAYVNQNVPSKSKKINDSTEGPPSATFKFDEVSLTNVL